MYVNIFEKEHFKTLIQFKDYIKFENILQQNEIPFFVEDVSNINISGYRRYYFLKDNFGQIEILLNKNGISPKDESYGISDFQQSKKIYKIYGIALLFLFFILFTLYLFSTFIRK
jgi:hypothetical protein